MNSQIKIFLIFFFLSITTLDSFAQSLTQIEYQEKVSCRGSLPMSDLGYYWADKLAPGYEIIQDLYFRVDDTKVDSIIVKLPIFSDSSVFLRIMPIPIGIELQLYDMNMKKIASNYIESQDKYYDGINATSNKEYYLVLKIRKPLSEKFKDKVFRVAVGKRNYKKEEIPIKQEKAKRKKKRRKN